VDPSASPRLPTVDSPGGGASRWPPFGALFAALLLVAIFAVLAAAVAGIPPFAADVATPSPSPSASATARSSPSPTASPSPPGAAEILERLAGIEQRMVEIRELSAGQPVTPKLVTSTEASDLLFADFRAENPTDFLADQTQLYRALGLLDPSDDLAAVFERFLSSQVLGFYRSTDRSLYVVSDAAFGPLQELTAAHEYTHALQDARFGLEALRPPGHDQGDLALAVLALVEGDATLAMSQWAIQDLTPEELSELFDQLQDPIAEQALADAPPIVRETQTFPYASGLQFVQQAWVEGGWSGVDRLWKRPPSTAEQILHPEKYVAGEEAIAVVSPEALPAALGGGWRLVLADTHGELVTRIWLEQALGPDAAAESAAGWGGDRVGLYRGPDAEWALVWITRWDSPAEALEFRSGAGSAAQDLDDPSTVRSSGSEVTIVVASDRAFIDSAVASLP